MPNPKSEKAAEDDYQLKWKQNPMLKPFIDKVVINIGVGKAGEELQKAFKVLQSLTDRKPVIITAKKSIKEWDVRKRQSIATKVTLRGDEAVAFLKRAIVPFDNRILMSAFDTKGNFSFGIDEHIKIPGVKYDPDLGIFGFNVAVKIVRCGFRIKTRKKERRKIGPSHYLSKKEAIYYISKVFGAEVVEKMEERYY
jgi:large subunit ribosomal protein L5